MNLDRIGTYKGYEVFKVGKRNIRENECLNDVMYIIAETGEIILNGEVVAHADLNKMSVDELPRSERKPYFYEARPKPTYSRGQRAKAKVYDEAVPSVVTAEVDNLFAGMDMIDKYIESALARNLVSKFEIPDLEV